MHNLTFTKDLTMGALLQVKLFWGTLYTLFHPILCRDSRQVETAFSCLRHHVQPIVGTDLREQGQLRLILKPDRAFVCFWKFFGTFGIDSSGGEIIVEVVLTRCRYRKFQYAYDNN